MSYMHEIYDAHADRYDALVRAEDHANNLQTVLDRILNWKGLSVLEAGVGTGRVTRLYIDRVLSAVCCDRSQHMLEFARAALSSHESRLEFVRADNLDLPSFEVEFDAFIEGWSFGHSAMECGTTQELRELTEVLIRNASKNLHAGACMILVETLGTCADSPEIPDYRLKTFYEELEDRHGFESRQIRTDYRFASIGDAIRLMGFFFGEGMGEKIRSRDSVIIPEWTGVWTKRIESK